MIRKILNTFGTRLISAILNLLITIIISQFLGPEGKGQQGLIVATIAYILVFSNLVGGAAIVYLVPRFAWHLIILPAYVWTVLSGILFYFILRVSGLVNPEFIIHICVLSVISGFAAINSSVLIGKEKIASANFVALIQPLLITLSLVLFYSLLEQISIRSYIISLYIAFGIALILSIYYVFRFAGKFNFEGFFSYGPVVKKLFRYGILNQLAHIFQLLSFRMSYYWLERLYSDAEVGVYSVGISLVESIWLISRSINMVQYARIANTDNLGYAQKLTINLAVAALVLSVAGLLILVLLPAEFFIFIYGKGFGEAGDVIRTLAPGVLLFNLALIVDHYFSGIGKYYVNTISSFFGMIAAAILFSHMIPAMGIIGAGWATTLSYTVTTAIVFIFFYREKTIGLKEALPSTSEMKELYKSLKDRVAKK